MLAKQLGHSEELNAQFELYRFFVFRGKEAEQLFVCKLVYRYELVGVLVESLVFAVLWEDFEVTVVAHKLTRHGPHGIVVGETLGQEVFDRLNNVGGAFQRRVFAYVGLRHSLYGFGFLGLRGYKVGEVVDALLGGQLPLALGVGA